MNTEWLLAQLMVQRTLIEFARAMDERDWPMLRSILTEDAVADLGGGPLHGSEAIVANIRGYLDACGPTQHMLGNLLIDIDGDTARSRCYVSDMHLGSGERSHLTFETMGDYHDRWRQIDGRWRITERVKHHRALMGSLEIFGVPK